MPPVTSRAGMIPPPLSICARAASTVRRDAREPRADLALGLRPVTRGALLQEDDLSVRDVAERHRP